MLDRTGKIREMIPPIADNPGVKDAAEAGFKSMQFQPILRNGVPVQATGRISVRFKTERPAGTEAFDGARNYFERGRKASFLAAGATAPYKLQAEFQLGTASVPVSRCPRRPGDFGRFCIWFVRAAHRIGGRARQMTVDFPTLLLQADGPRTFAVGTSRILVLQHFADAGQPASRHRFRRSEAGVPPLENMNTCS